MSRKLLILGAGGHGRVIADIIRRQEDAELLGFLDDRCLGDVNGYPCLGPIRELERIISDSAHHRLGLIIGIGDNHTRRALQERLKPIVIKHNLYFATVIDPSAVISPHATLGEGTVVMPNAVVNTMELLSVSTLLLTLPPLSITIAVSMIMRIYPQEYIWPATCTLAKARI